MCLDVVGGVEEVNEGRLWSQGRLVAASPGTENSNVLANREGGGQCRDTLGKEKRREHTLYFTPVVTPVLASAWERSSPASPEYSTSPEYTSITPLLWPYGVSSDAAICCHSSVGWGDVHEASSVAKVAFGAFRSVTSPIDVTWQPPIRRTCSALPCGRQNMAPGPTRRLSPVGSY